MNEPARILILEDEFMIAMEFETVLLDAGYGVVGPAADVGTAMGLIDTECPDAGVLDVNLGRGETSAAVAQRLGNLSVPFVLCTGYQTSELVQRYGDTVPILQKPVDAVKLVEVLRCLMSPSP
ncbi:response regulator [Microbaculum marinisediminis]|uniref:Response regulator n=1 Tax=Microbaculum marinisediminis TaxID=2931392 RepID=A0AAW5R0E2_9HYPH|nr:response regulator [Microbaculum sp. A6E488]MCT8973652.1 response regulator [Microbaculum sp. A6E488]